LGVNVRTLQRWAQHPGVADRRKGPHASPQHALTNEEKEKMLQIANSEKYRDLSPHHIVAKLVDEGHYIASESSFYRLLRSQNLLSHRSKNRPRTNHPPRALTARGANQVWSWDITFLRSAIKGQYYYLYG